MPGKFAEEMSGIIREYVVYADSVEAAAPNAQFFASSASGDVGSTSGLKKGRRMMYCRLSQTSD